MSCCFSFFISAKKEEEKKDLQHWKNICAFQVSSLLCCLFLSHLSASSHHILILEKNVYMYNIKTIQPGFGTMEKR